MSLGLIIASRKHLRFPYSVFHLKATSLSFQLLRFLCHPKTHPNTVLPSVVCKGKVPLERRVGCPHPPPEGREGARCCKVLRCCFISQF